MFFLFILDTISSPEINALYIGNSTSKITNDFNFSYYFNSTLCQSCSSLSLKLKEPISNQTIPLQSTLYGISFHNQSFFYLGFLNQNRTFNETIQIINQSLTNLNLTEIREYQQVCHYISSQYPEAFYLIFNTTGKSEIINHSFFTSKKATGFLLFESTFSINFTSKEFNTQLFYSELKIFNEILISFMISSTILWFYLFYTKIKKIDSGDISDLTLFMHQSYESCCTLILLKIDETYLFLNGYYSITIYLLLIRSFITSAIIGDYIKYYYNRIKNAIHFIKLIGSILFYSVIYWNTFLYSSLYITLVYSISIPHIFNYIKSKKKVKNTLFMNSMLLIKLIPLYYFTCHKNNILCFYSPLFCIWICLYVIVQIVFVVLQSKYGGNLIFLKTKLVTPYNYDKDKGLTCPICFDEIKDNEDKIITPCLHCFHRQCLQEWMKRKFICPVCRNDISLLN